MAFLCLLSTIIFPSSVPSVSLFLSRSSHCSALVISLSLLFSSRVSDAPQPGLLSGWRGFTSLSLQEVHRKVEQTPLRARRADKHKTQRLILLWLTLSQQLFWSESAACLNLIETFRVLKKKFVNRNQNVFVFFLVCVILRNLSYRTRASTKLALNGKLFDVPSVYSSISENGKLGPCIKWLKSECNDRQIPKCFHKETFNIAKS